MLAHVCTHVAEYRVRPPRVSACLGRPGATLMLAFLCARSCLALSVAEWPRDRRLHSCDEDKRSGFPHHGAAMKLITWNIQWGRGADGRVDLERILAHARRLAD